MNFILMFCIFASYIGKQVDWTARPMIRLHFGFLFTSCELANVKNKLLHCIDNSSD